MSWVRILRRIDCCRRKSDRRSELRLPSRPKFFEIPQSFRSVQNTYDFYVIFRAYYEYDFRKFVSRANWEKMHIKLINTNLFQRNSFFLLTLYCVCWLKIHFFRCHILNQRKKPHRSLMYLSSYGNSGEIRKSSVGSEVGVPTSDLSSDGTIRSASKF